MVFSRGKKHKIKLHEKKEKNGNTWNKMNKNQENTWNNYEINQRTWNKQIKKHKKNNKTTLTRKHVEMWVTIKDFWEPYSKTWIV